MPAATALLSDINMSWVHIFTVSISTIENVYRELRSKLERREGLSDYEIHFINVVEKAKRAVPSSEEERLCEAELSKLTDVLLKWFKTKDDMKRLSAELNAYLSLVEENPMYAASEIHLLTTATGLGRFCGEVLRRVIREQLGIYCEVHVISRWGWGPEYFDEALLCLMDTASKIMSRSKERGYNVAMNLTGGFKPECSFLYVLASLYDVDLVYYIHETFRKVVTLPVLKLTLDRSLLEKLLQVFSSREVVPAHELPLEFKTRGLVRERREAENYTLRPWVRKLLEDFRQRARQS